MNRREFVAAAGAAATLGALGQDALAQDPHASHRGGGDAWDRCVQECNKCLAACGKACEHCTREAQSGKGNYAPVAALCSDCASCCALTSCCAAKRSDITAAMCEACAKACDKCALECDKLGGDVMKACATACRDCASACRDLAKEAGPMTSHTGSGNRTRLPEAGVTTYTCPMHPEIERPSPGKCPKCGMDLVPKT